MKCAVVWPRWYFPVLWFCYLTLHSWTETLRLDSRIRSSLNLIVTEPATVAKREKQKQAMKCTRLHDSCSSRMICDEPIKQGQRRCQSEHHVVVQRCTAVCGHNRCHFLTVHFPSLCRAFPLCLWLIVLLHLKIAATDVFVQSEAPMQSLFWRFVDFFIVDNGGYIHMSCSWDKSIKHGYISVYTWKTQWRGQQCAVKIQRVISDKPMHPNIRGQEMNVQEG